MSNNFKPQSTSTGRTMGDIIINNNDVKDPWDCNSESHRGGDLPDGFSWPPRSYTCSFCKREFRSAQALGGHMNVHRRDRARLRQSPPRDGQFSPINLNLDPNPIFNLNPNPNFSCSLQSSSPSKKFPPFNPTLPPLVSPSLSSLSSFSSASPSEINKLWSKDHFTPGGADFAKTMNSTKTLFGVSALNGFTNQKECKTVKKTEVVRLDLEIGLLNDSKEDLDLELRLGYT